MQLNQSGIYEIVCRPTGVTYVGQAISISRRFAGHRCLLHKGTHRNAHLQRAWDKYGAENFDFLLIEFCTIEKLTSRERFHLWIVADRVFNIAPPGPTPMLGRRHTAETSQKIKRAKQRSGSLALVTIDGVTQSAARHAAARGISKGLLTYRRRGGLTVEEALALPVRSAECFTAFGKTETLAKLCAETGVDVEVARARIKQLGWSVEQAITAPHQYPIKLLNRVA